MTTTDTDRCYHGRCRIDPCINCGRRYVNGMLVGAFLTERLPWSATDCEVCEGTGALTDDDNGRPAPCWYCKGSGWYEAAT
jgi:hypothetical protein